MTTAFQQNAFQNNAFQILISPFSPGAAANLAQLDQGIQFQSVLSYHGPTLGWVRSFVKSEKFILAPGTITLGAGDSIVLVAATGLVTVNLPDVRSWVLQPVYQPYDPIDRAIWVKDLGGNAVAFPISVVPFGSQKIDGRPSVSMVSNHAIMRVYPLYDLTGWYVDGP